MSRLSRRFGNGLESTLCNLKEARVALVIIRRSCRTIAHLNKRHLGLSDNMTTVLALDKGRSSMGLKAICRRAAAYQLAANQQWKWRFIESARNVADWGSRRLAAPKAGVQTSSTRPPLGLEHIIPNTYGSLVRATAS